ncbi:MAG: NAD(P)/FAD-dependent oxidoreductase [Trueperaceae bacterium]
MRYDVAIVGAGVVGCAIARELSKHRLSVALLERDVEVGLGTSKANSGIIHGGHRAHDGTLKAATEWRGNQLWGDLAEELPFGFQRNGDLTVAFDEADVAVLVETLEQGQRRGVPGLEIWDAERLRREEPNLSHDAIAALHAPTSGVVNPYEACFALAESAVRNGVDLKLEHAVVGIDRGPDGFVLRTDRGDVSARFVVNAAGLFGDAVARMAGAEAPTLRARKGEEYLLDKRLAGYVKRVVFPTPNAESKGILLIPTYDGTLMVGPTAHWTADDGADKTDLDTSAVGAAEVFAGARKLAPGIAEADTVAEFAGLRAVADGEDFVIGATEVPGFLNVIGIQSPGLTAAPAIAEDVVALLAAQGLALEPKPDFVPTLEAPVRCADLDFDELARVVRSDPRFGRIACRCELVTEGEVLAAIDRGARTMDGVKFRTRAGMGRCQGGFCAWRVMSLIAEATDVPIPAVTKKGGGSWIARERQDAPDVPAEARAVSHG